MTQPELVKMYVQEFGSITPAHEANKHYGEGKFGSELPRTCRKMREKNVLLSRPDKEGYERFFFPSRITLPPAFAPKEKVENKLF